MRNIIYFDCNLLAFGLVKSIDSRAPCIPNGSEVASCFTATRTILVYYEVLYNTYIYTDLYALVAGLVQDVSLVNNEDKLLS